MIDRIKDIFKVIDDIEYGFKDENGNNIINDTNKWDNEFYKFYYLLEPSELLEKKCGVCWDQVELERKILKDNNIKHESYFICTYDGDNLPSHTFIIINDSNKCYWYEHSWNIYKGIHEYNNLKEALIDIKNKFIEFNKKEYKDINTDYTFMYKYDKPKKHIKCEEFYQYVETCELIKLNEPLYFYHLINKNSNVSKGILSLQYMYDNKLYDLFDKCVLKYKDRITNDWGLEEYKNKELSRIDYINALNKFRGEYGSSYIYFFRYPPFDELGPHMKSILDVKDIYRININDEEVLKNIKDIFYGYNMSNSDNEMLNKEYYMNVSELEYFSKYDDSLKMNFSTLNHISIAFINDYCDIKFLEKINRQS